MPCTAANGDRFSRGRRATWGLPSSSAASSHCCGLLGNYRTGGRGNVVLVVHPSLFGPVPAYVFVQDRHHLRHAGILLILACVVMKSHVIRVLHGRGQLGPKQVGVVAVWVVPLLGRYSELVGYAVLHVLAKLGKVRLTEGILGAVRRKRPGHLLRG